MKIEEIEYEEREGKYGSVLGLYMPGGYWVGKKLFVTTWSLCLKGIPSPNFQELVVAETVIGTDYWKSQTVGVRIAMGRCLKYYVDHEWLPLKVANPRKKGKRKYIRI